MRFLIIFLFLLACCGPAELETELESVTEVGNDSAQDEAESEVVQLGFLETSCGHNIGQNACDFALSDKDGEHWQLSDHVGDLVLIDLSAMWCGPCQQAAMTAEETQEAYKAQGFHYVTILIVDSQNDTVELADQLVWADLFGINTAPVLQGDRDLLTSSGAAHGYPLESWPTFILLDRTHTVVFGLRGFDESIIRQAIEDHI